MIRHCGFQTEPRALRNFGDELQIPLYVEILENEDIGEFPPDVLDEGKERIRHWGIVPKRLVEGLQTINVIMDNGKLIRVCKIGKYIFCGYLLLVLVSFLLEHCIDQFVIDMKTKNVKFNSLFHMIYF